jgi:hypothetical protein
MDLKKQQKSNKKGQLFDLEKQVNVITCTYITRAGTYIHMAYIHNDTYTNPSMMNTYGTLHPTLIPSIYVSEQVTHITYLGIYVSEHT